MFSLFLKCISCKGALSSHDHSSFPLCRFCAKSLVTCPALCPVCGLPTCLDQSSCKRPWSQDSAVSSYSARYLSIGTGYTVLKNWKKKSGLLFDRQILKSNADLVQIWKNSQAQVIVPIPQRLSRAWKMRGNRTEKIARWVSQETGLPIAFALQKKNPIRQAELDWIERLQTDIPFVIENPKALSGYEHILLVDDFRTSGRTLKQAAAALKSQLSLRSIHAFTLGIRIPQLNSKC